MLSYTPKNHYKKTTIYRQPLPMEHETVANHQRHTDGERNVVGLKILDQKNGGTLGTKKWQLPTDGECHRLLKLPTGVGTE